ncbi:hypothetical protein GCM10009801_58020 [Streptomyces albiaxialis]|uniref:Uncharacterized protein n=1 Tax=Streptomyces albiaxialis TaxID=329523 RepID=A0ABN2WHB1_9ACTN
MGKSDIRDTVEEETDKKGDEGKREKRIDLSLTQVMGSAVATVVAAFLAGQLGVYGTFIGAGVVSLMATSGGPIFQHLFRRTGEQIKEATVQAKPRTRRLPVQDPAPTWKDRQPDDDATRIMPQGAAPAPDEVRPPDQVQMLDTSEVTRMLPQAHTRAGEYAGHREDDATTVLRAADPRPGQYGEHGEYGQLEEDDEFTRATTHGTKWRGWKRTLLPALLVFVIAIGGITLYEAIAGHNVSGGKGTSISDVFRPAGSSGGDSPDTTDTTPSPGQSDDGDGDGDGSSGGQHQDGGQSADPDRSGSGEKGERGTGSGDSDSGSTPTPDPGKQRPSDQPTDQPSEQPTDPGGTGDGQDGSGQDGTGAGAGGRQQAPQQQPDPGQS